MFVFCTCLFNPCMHLNQMRNFKKSHGPCNQLFRVVGCQDVVCGLTCLYYTEMVAVNIPLRNSPLKVPVEIVDLNLFLFNIVLWSPDTDSHPELPWRLCPCMQIGTQGIYQLQVHYGEPHVKSGGNVCILEAVLKLTSVMRE